MSEKEVSEKEMLVKVGSTKYSLPNVALLLMMVAIILPAVNYSLWLKNPTPSELLVAICIALFSSVVFLWILDVTGVLPFKSGWVSKSVYGAAIASVLGTSVAVYSEYFSQRKHPYEGKWELTIQELAEEKC